MGSEEYIAEGSCGRQPFFRGDCKAPLPTIHPLRWSMQERVSRLAEIDEERTAQRRAKRQKKKVGAWLCLDVCGLTLHVTLSRESLDCLILMASHISFSAPTLNQSAGQGSQSLKGDQ